MHASEMSRESEAVAARLKDRGAVELARHGLRPEVRMSWRRSQLSGVDPDRLTPRYEPDALTDSGFMTTSAKLIDHFFGPLEDGPTGIMLTDRHGRIHRTWGGTNPVRDFLTKLGAEPGFVFTEDALGTNGLGTALETGRAVKISGPEHFLTAYSSYVCAAAPVRHPVTRALLGAVNVARRDDEDDDLMLPWVATLAREIEAEMLQRTTRVDRLVFDRFLAASRDARSAVVCLSQQMMISNPAARSIEELGRPFVWEEIARGASSGTFTLPSGGVVPIRTEEIIDGGETVGLVVEFGHRATARPGSRTSPAVTDGGREDDALRHRCADARRLLVVGEPGSGKSTLICEAFARTPGVQVAQFDCALREVEGAEWSRQLAARLTEPRVVVLLTHVEYLDARAAATVCALLDRAGDDTRVMATANSDSAVDQSLVDRLTDGQVRVPSLVQRRHHLAELVQVLTDRHTPRRPAPVWTSEAVRALTRAPWPGNIRQLESVVRVTLSRCQSGTVEVHHLPPDVLATVSSRTLTRLEQVELTEIIRALTATKGNRAQTAAQLGIGRTTLYRRLRYFGIDPDHTFPVADRPPPPGETSEPG